TFAAEALAIFARKKNLRLLALGEVFAATGGWSVRSVAGGLLVQAADTSVEAASAARVVTRRPPTADELLALDFAWRVGKHVKSNAIVFCHPGRTAAIGAGQMSRVDAARLAMTKATAPLTGTCVGSDAFFPFRDGIDVLHEAGATAVIQPGGSIRDDEVIAACDEHDMAMVLTGVRHFRH
ncbi:MAG TPA: bifunctional phosphoribosylaminoimidazolecarboxamide formyltransferase/IMP cyclohydrolase, partial [Kofleriaceae bacterium]|nr:bifunctional phosphoribosylaminoimidazolecarboxamide formyltransferase/IMP cyclohydrolase [Kofleriaceae bacterium]